MIPVNQSLLNMIDNMEKAIITYENMDIAFSSGFAFQPVLQKISEIANNPMFGILINGVINSLSIVGNVIAEIFNVIASVACFIYENWSTIAPLLIAAAIALGVFNAALGIHNITAGID